MRFRVLVLALAVGLTGCGDDADSPLHLADLSAVDDMAAAPRDLAAPDLRAPDLARLSWVQQSVPVPTSLYAIAGVPGEIYVVGDQGVILRSTDDGAHWILQRTDTSAALFGVWTDGVTAVAVGYHGTLLRSIDHGATWEPRPFGAATLLGVGGGSVAIDDGGAPSRLWAVGEAATLLQSDDDGATWAQSGTSFPAGNLYGVWFSPVESFVVGNSGLFRTRDDGASWTQIIAGAATGNEVWATGSGQILIADGSSIVRSRDGGLTWSAAVTADSGFVGFAAFPDGELWAASSKGGILHYMNDFEDPIAADAADVGHPIAAIWGRDPGDVFVVGDNGFIAHRQ